MEFVRWSGPKTVDRPVLFIAFEGWVSAGGVGRLALDALVDGAVQAAEFDADRCFDYRVNRPIATFESGSLVDLDWPALRLDLGRIGGRSVITLTGPEPNWNWQALSSALVDLAGSLGVTEVVSLGGIPWAAPHTRPVTIVTTASDPARLSDEDEIPEGALRVPSSFTLAVEWAAKRAGFPTVGFWARVPHYLGSDYPVGGLALAERILRHLGEETDLAVLADEAASERRRLDALVEARDDLAGMVAGLEDLYDREGAVSGDVLAAEIERFLRGED